MFRFLREGTKPFVSSTGRGGNSRWTSTNGRITLDRSLGWRLEMWQRSFLQVEAMAAYKMGQIRRGLRRQDRTRSNPRIRTTVSGTTKDDESHTTTLIWYSLPARKVAYRPGMSRVGALASSTPPTKVTLEFVISSGSNQTTTRLHTIPSLPMPKRELSSGSEFWLYHFCRLCAFPECQKRA